MTERLYYTDPYCREFDATVTDARTQADGRTVVRLDRTAFYPTSGGQPYDVGTLGAARVVDVQDEEADGSLVHVVEGKIDAGARVHGAIDWTRRFDHMQQHTGQHVLSAAFDRLFGVRTVSFHLGAALSTIDLARETTRAEIGAAEDEANRIVWEDREVAIRFVSPEEAARLPLRKEPVREGTLRLIDIKDFDLSACGGTHVARTGAIGAIVIRSAERFKGGQRVEFLCGGRAVVAFRALSDVVDASVRLTSVTPAELPPTIERYQREAKDLRRQIAAAQSDLARYRADEFVASAEPIAGFHAVLRSVDADANGLKVLAAAVATRPRHVAVLVTPTAPALAVVASAPDVGVQANKVLASLLTTFGGRGGGKPEMAQGGGLNGRSEEILKAAREQLAR